MKAIPAILSIGLWLSICATPAQAGTAMGPAMATVEKGQWSLGIEYAYESATLSADGHCVESIIGYGSDRYDQRFEIDDLETNMFFGRLTYGLSDEWDVFVRLGATDAQDDIQVNGTGILTGANGGRVSYDGSYGLAWGVGTRATFWTSGPWSFAGLAQATWLDPDDSRFRLTDPDSSNETIVEGTLDSLQAQFSLAAIYQEESWGAWIGPFLQLIDGDLDLDAQFVIDGVTQGTITCSGDVEEESQVGLHAGIACGLAPNLACWVEGQYTPDSWLLGIGAVVRPQ